MKTTSEPQKLSPRKVRAYGRNSAVEEMCLQFENPVSDMKTTSKPQKLSPG
jgi:hypothetical protein